MQSPDAMPPRADSAQLLALIGSAGGFFLANYDRLLASLCAIVGIGYTLWKWRKEARRSNKTGE